MGSHTLRIAHLEAPILGGREAFAVLLSGETFPLLLIPSTSLRSC
jgi:hypothetical protein